MSSPSIFFPGGTSTTRDKKDVKPIENPYLINTKQQSFAASSAVARSSPSAGILATLSPNNTNGDSSMLGLRNRKGVGGPPHIPKESYSVGGGLLISTATTPSASSHYDDRHQSHHQQPSVMYRSGLQRDHLLLEPCTTSTTEAGTITRTLATTDTTAPRQHHSLLLLPHTTGCWVMVYGFGTRAQYDKVLETFSSFGHVVASRGTFRPGIPNWIALQYSSQLEAENALCHNHMKLMTLEDNDNALMMFCGVKRLLDNDPILMMQDAEQDLTELWKKTTASGDRRHDFDEQQVGDTTGTSLSHRRSDDTPLEEKDILLYTCAPKEKRVRGPSEQSVCEKFARWLFSVR